MSGTKMTYNLKTKKGRVVKGGTKADDGYYTGSEIRNETKKTVFIKNRILNIRIYKMIRRMPTIRT